MDFGIPRDAEGKDDLLAPWHVTDNLGRLDLTFTPVLDRAAHTGALVLESNQHQVFGRFDGAAVLDDGRTLDIRGLGGKGQKPLVMRRALACEIMEERNCENC